MRQDIRQITDVRTLRALAHPVRVALLETLHLSGPMTATEIGERIGETPTTCSFHLRQLARYGLVEEAGGGKGRARPWKTSAIGFDIESVTDDPEMEVAWGIVGQMLRERQRARLQRWLETRSSYPKKWRKAAGDSTFLLYVTPQELQDLSAAIVDLVVGRFHDRIADPTRRPKGAAPVEMVTVMYPIEPPDRDR